MTNTTFPFTLHILKHIWKENQLAQTTLTFSFLLWQPQNPHKDGEENNLIPFFTLEALQGLSTLSNSMLKTMWNCLWELSSSIDECAVWWIVQLSNPSFNYSTWMFVLRLNGSLIRLDRPQISILWSFSLLTFSTASWKATTLLVFAFSELSAMLIQFLLLNKLGILINNKILVPLEVIITWKYFPSRHMTRMSILCFFSLLTT